VDAVLALRPQRLGDVPRRLAPCAPSRRCPRRRRWPARQQAHRQHPEEGRQGPTAHVSEQLLQEDAEKALYAATQKIAPQAALAVRGWRLHRLAADARRVCAAGRMPSSTT
jgi:glycyl-tRNA synthetase beta chain